MEKKGKNAPHPNAAQREQNFIRQDKSPIKWPQLIRGDQGEEDRVLVQRLSKVGPAPL